VVRFMNNSMGGCEADIQTGSCTRWLTIYMLVLNVQYNMCEEKKCRPFLYHESGMLNNISSIVRSIRHIVDAILFLWQKRLILKH